MKYCPACKGRLYPFDAKYIKKYGKCSYCVTFAKKEKNDDKLGR